MKTRLLRQVQKEILAHPTQMNMRSFFGGCAALKETKEVERCGTTACIAGWVFALHCKINLRQAAERNAMPAMSVDDRAAKILGLNFTQRQRLFFDADWPNRFYCALHHSKTIKEYAKVVARRIDHFIKTKGEE